MTDKMWKEILTISQELGDDCLKTIEGLGKNKYETMQNKLITQSQSHEEKTIVEWIIAMWRYHKAVGDRSFTERELDKITRWSFNLLWLQGRVTDQFQSLVLASGELEDNKNIVEMRGAITGLNNFADEADAISTRLTEFFKRMADMSALEIDGYTKGIVSRVEELHNEATSLARRTTKGLKAIEALAKEVTVDTSQVKSKKESLETISKEIVAIESELNLKIQHGSDSKESWVTSLLLKGDRYIKDNPQLFTWHCPECAWEGILAKRHPPEGALINVMNKWWTWRCPDCGEILAYDRKHPQYEKWGQQSIVFNHRAWVAVCEKRMSLLTMADFLNTDPEWPLLAAKRFYGLEIPEHVQKEFDDHERDFISNKDDTDLQEVGDMSSFSDGDDT